MSAALGTVRRRVRSRVRSELARRPGLRLRVWDLRRRLRLGRDPADAGPPVARRDVVSLPLPARPDGRPARATELVIEAPASMFVVRSLDAHGIGGYEAEALACFLAMTDLAPPGQVLDVGANIGIYGLLAGALSDREVIAFEPTPWIAREAGAAAKRNGLPLDVRAMALGDQRTIARFYLSDRTDSSNSLAGGFRPSTRQIDVRVETLDHLVARERLRPAVVKIDTETTEPQVVRGAARTLAELRPWVICEVLAGRSEDELAAAFAPFGYTMYHVRDEVPYTATEILVGDPEHEHLMWLFLPEPAPPRLWTSIREWRTALDAVAR